MALSCLSDLALTVEGCFFSFSHSSGEGKQALRLDGSLRLSTQELRGGWQEVTREEQEALCHRVGEAPSGRLGQ